MGLCLLIIMLQVFLKSKDSENILFYKRTMQIYR